MKKILVVFSCTSGTSDKEKVKELVKDFLPMSSFELHWYFPCGTDDIVKLQDAVKKFSPEILLACGGDGTCNLAATAAISKNIPMCIIPDGSANGLAKELNIPLDLSKALELLNTGKESVIDYMLVNDTLCIRQAEVGINAQLIQSFEAAKGRGMLTYVNHFFRNLFKWGRFSFKLKTDTEIFAKRKAISVTFANARKFGTGAIINPIGSIDDGQFEIVVIRSFPLYSLPSIFLRFFTGRIHKSIFFDILTCKNADVSLKHRKLLQIDGEVIGKVKEIHITIVPKGLRILTP